MKLGFDIWTDGASAGTKDCEGGWAAVIVDRDGGTKLVITGWDESTTNNRMELTAVVQALRALGDQAVVVTIHTDSAYVKNAFTDGYVRTWQENGWISYRGDPVANRDLWEQLLAVSDRHFVTWKKIRGHKKKNGRIVGSVVVNPADPFAVRAKKERLELFELI